MIIHWESLNGIILKKPKTLPRNTIRQLQQLGYKNDNIDTVILKVAYQLNDKTIVSKDSDFWDPKNKNKQKNKNSPVTKYCREQLGITIMLLDTLYKNIN